MTKTKSRLTSHFFKDTTILMRCIGLCFARAKKLFNRTKTKKVQQKYETGLPASTAKFAAFAVDYRFLKIIYVPLVYLFLL